MTCQSALEMLLDADLFELAATADSALGSHLRTCARCRRVAGQVLADTRQLATAMATAVPQRRPARRLLHVALAPALAVAALVVAIMLRGETRPSDRPAIADVPRPVQAPPPAATVIVATSDVTQPRTRSVQPRPVARRAFARAVPLASVRLEPSQVPTTQLSVETSGVTVTPSPGTRATVMHTSNPKFLVVWLY